MRLDIYKATSYDDFYAELKLPQGMSCGLVVQHIDTRLYMHRVSLEMLAELRDSITQYLEAKKADEWESKRTSPILNPHETSQPGKEASGSHSHSSGSDPADCVAGEAAPT